MPTDLDHITDTASPEALLQQSCFSWSLGPLTITACIDLSKPSVTVSATILGVSIGSGTLDPSNTTITIGGGALGFKAEVTLTMDFTTLRLTISAKVCAPIVGCKEGSTVISL